MLPTTQQSRQHIAIPLEAVWLLQPEAPACPDPLEIAASAFQTSTDSGLMYRHQMHREFLARSVAVSLAHWSARWLPLTLERSVDAMQQRIMAWQLTIGSPVHRPRGPLVSTSYEALHCFTDQHELEKTVVERLKNEAETALKYRSTNGVDYYYATLAHSWRTLGAEVLFFKLAQAWKWRERFYKAIKAEIHAAGFLLLDEV